MSRLLFLVFTWGFILFLSSCLKEKQGDNFSFSGNFKAKINGTQWVANKTAGANRFGNFISLFGVSTDMKMVIITLTDSGTHRYTLNQNSINVGVFLDSNFTNTDPFATNLGVSAKAGGEVNITSIDTVNKKMTGTFNYKVYRIADDSVINFTEGRFTNLSYATGIPPDGSKPDTFRVKIGGEEWKPSGILSTILPAPYNNNLFVGGWDLTTSKNVGMYFPFNITTGIYNFSPPGPCMGYYNADNNSSNLKLAILGTLTILEHQPAKRRIRGNFNFIASDLLNPLNTASLSEGYFSVTYY